MTGYGRKTYRRRKIKSTNSASTGKKKKKRNCKEENKVELKESLHAEFADQCSLLLKNPPLLPEACYSFKTHFTLCLGKLGAILIKLPGQAPRSGAMKLVTFHTYRGQVGKDTTQSRSTFTTRLEVMPESTSYLQELSVQASSCPVTPSSLPPSLPAQSERGSGAGRAGGSQAHGGVCRRAVSP